MIRSLSSTFVDNPPDPSTPRGEGGRGDRCLVPHPKLPPDPDQPLSLHNLTEAVWSLVTLPVSTFFFFSLVQCNEIG